MLTRTTVALCLVLSSFRCYGQTVDGVCRLVTPTLQWSGVAISDSEVLTVEHHNLRPGEKVRIEFPVDRHNGEVRVSIVGEVAKVDDAMDLSLIRYSAPKWLKVKSYELSPSRIPLRKREKVEIRGFIWDQAMLTNATLFTDDRTVRGHVINTFNAQAVQGMSGSPVIFQGSLVGIQFGGDKRVTDAVTVRTVETFLRRGQKF